MKNYPDLRETLLQVSPNPRNTIVIPRAFVKFTGSLENAMFLSQLLYWTPRGSRKDGFIAKTDDEWQEELYLTQYAIRKARKELEDMGILETALKKWKGAPTTHYRLRWEELTKQWLEWVKTPDLSSAQKGSCASEKSLDSAPAQKGSCASERSLTENTYRDYTDNTNSGERRDRRSQPLDYELKMQARPKNFLDVDDEEEENSQGSKTYDPDTYIPGQDEGPAPTLSSRNTEYKKQMKPKTELQKHFLNTLRHKRFKPGIKSKLNALARAFQEGERLGNDVYQICARALDGLPAQLDPHDLPPMPHNWYWYRCEHAERHADYWSQEMFINALLNNDKLRQHCQIMIKKLGLDKVRLPGERMQAPDAEHMRRQQEKQDAAFREAYEGMSQEERDRLAKAAGLDSLEELLDA